MSQFENFSEFYNKINDSVTNPDNFILYKGFKENFKIYGNLFKLGIYNDKLGFKTSAFINQSHYDGRNMWLVKAIDLNRGRCIKIGNNLEEIKAIIKKFYDGIYRDFKNAEKEKEKEEEEKNKQKEKKDKEKGKEKNKYDFRKYRSSCVLLQKYIEKPLLYLGRKFDIRIWVLYTHNDCVYAFKEGHLKTSSFKYNIMNNDQFVHLTNYSVQKYSKEFAKYEFGNELPFKDFQNVLDSEHPNITIRKHIFPRIKELIKLTFHSVKDKINLNRRNYCFEIFGFDFIIDKYYNINILEVNTNPGLEESSPWIKIIVPRMIDDAFRLTIDNLYETKYANSAYDKEKNYNSPYPVENYTPSENLWDLVTDFSDYYNY